VNNAVQNDTGGQNNKKVLISPQLEKFFTLVGADPIKFIDLLVEETVKLSASDVFFEPRKEHVLVRARIDGLLYEIGKMNSETYNHVNSRIKVLSKLDPSEKRKVQEGQFSVDKGGVVINLRVEIAQSILGELIVIRIHQKKTIVLDISELGLGKNAYEKYKNIVSQKSGLVVVCGPTGCGKTTTLYSTLSVLDKDKSINIMTIEDPVEFPLDGVNQMQVQEDIGFSFADGLKTLLRLSPDVILVGEIRDKETAKIAIESGLTGQLVLSTLHAEDSVGALFRLLDLGIESYLLNSALVGVVSQRLVRRNCEACKISYHPQQEEIDLFKNVLGEVPSQLYKSTGCAECQNLGFKGRVGIFEVLAVDSMARNLVRNKANETELRTELNKAGLITLLKDGLVKAANGLTTANEVLRNSLRVV
jgi:type II secretory ATPase GspE/PulE/Tfp pilus assembly ATPase PilB-like protein